MITLARHFKPTTLRMCFPQAMLYSKKCPVGKSSANPEWEKIKKLQTHFQKKDGKPIFLKGGMYDTILYRATWVLCFIGLAGNIHLYLQYILY